MRTFECVRGLTNASTVEFGNMLFEVIFPILQDAVKLFQVYNNFVEIVVIILEMFLDVVESLLCILNKVSCGNCLFLNMKVCTQKIMNKTNKIMLEKKFSSLIIEFEIHNLDTLKDSSKI